jgi:hypothetical protein
MKKTNDIVLPIIGLIIFIPTLLSLWALDNSKEQELMQKEYCENVHIWNDSKGENGHPNYKDLDCTTE